MILFERNSIPEVEYINSLKCIVEQIKNYLNDDEIEALSKVADTNCGDYPLHFIDTIKFAINYVCPLGIAISYLAVTDIKTIIEKEEINNIINNPLSELPDWSKVYESLNKLFPFLLNFYIAQIDCSNYIKNNLLKALTEKDSNLFIDTVSNMGKESYLLKNVSDLYDCLFMKLSAREVLTKNAHLLNYVKTTLQEEAPSFMEMLELLEKATGNKPESKVDPCEYEKVTTILMALYLSLRETYIKKREYYTKEIRDILDPFIVDPENISLYLELEKRDSFMQLVENKDLEDITFDNLKIFCNNPDSDKNEFFNGLDPQIVKEGDEKFKMLVNYIADSGYIENSNEAKQLFTYRLTGRCKPVRLCKLYWDGRENRSANELIYIVRFATDTGKSKYIKMRKFFEGPIFPDEGTSEYGDRARIDFREYLYRLYPDVFVVKGALV